jgi:hypothetical protein
VTEAIRGFRDDLVAAAQRARRRRVRRARVAGLAGLALVAVAALSVALAIGGSSPAEAGVEIGVRDGRVTARLVDVETRPAVVEDALRDAGIDASITGVAAGPSNVGRFVGSSSELPEEIDQIDPSEASFAGIDVPVGYEGHLELFLGVPADPGQSYDVASDVFAPGELLACADLAGQPLPELLARPELDGVNLRFQPQSPSAPSTPLDDVAGTEYATWYVSAAVATSANDVLVLLAEEPVDAALPAGC